MLYDSPKQPPCLDFVRRLIFKSTMSWKTPCFHLQVQKHQTRFVQHAFEEDLREIWKEIRILEAEKSTIYRNYKEAAHMSCLQYRIGKHSTEISPIFCSLISKELKIKQYSEPMKVHNFLHWWC
jgi:hypothetical protein